MSNSVAIVISFIAIPAVLFTIVFFIHRKELTRRAEEIIKLKVIILKNTRLLRRDSAPLSAVEARIAGNERVVPTCATCEGMGLAYYGGYGPEHGKLYDQCRDCEGNGMP